MKPVVFIGKIAQDSELCAWILRACPEQVVQCDQSFDMHGLGT